MRRAIVGNCEIEKSCNDNEASRILVVHVCHQETVLSLHDFMRCTHTSSRGVSTRVSWLKHDLIKIGVEWKHFRLTRLNGAPCAHTHPNNNVIKLISQKNTKSILISPFRKSDTSFSGSSEGDGLT